LTSDPTCNFSKLAQWSEALQAAQTSTMRAEALFRPPNAYFKPMARQAKAHLETIAFPGILQFSKIVMMMMTYSGEVTNTAPDRKKNMFLTDL
jgi:hypothetical protein